MLRKGDFFMRKFNIKNHMGFTLVELIVAFAVFMILVVMAFPVMIYAGKSNSQARNNLSVQEVGEEVVEELVYLAPLFVNESVFKDYLIAPNSKIYDDGAFSRITDNTYEMKKNQTTIVLSFFENSNRIIVRVNDNASTYETIEWLQYEE